MWAGGLRGPGEGLEAKAEAGGAGEQLLPRESPGTEVQGLVAVRREKWGSRTHLGVAAGPRQTWTSALGKELRQGTSGGDTSLDIWAWSLGTPVFRG